MIWLALATMTALALLITLRPLLRAPGGAAADDDRSLAVYRQQLQEVDQDLERGLVSDAEATAARIEIKRRILALRPAGASLPVGRGRPFLIAVAAVLAAVPPAIYLTIGSPGLPGHRFDPQAEIQEERAQLTGQVDAMMDKLTQHLKDNPGDGLGWRALGWAQLQVGRIPEGVASLGKAAALLPKDASLQSLYGEALVRAANGEVTADALAAFTKALASDPKEPRARFYSGLALTQSGRDAEALKIWRAIIADSPPDAEWLPAIRQQADELEAKMRGKDRPAP